MDHTEELTTLDLAEVSLTHGECNPLKCMFRLQLKLQLSAIFGQSAECLHIVYGYGIGQKHAQLIDILVADIAANALNRFNFLQGEH